MSSRKTLLLAAISLLLFTTVLTQKEAQNRKKCLKEDDNGLCIKCNLEFYLEDNLCYLCSDACKQCLDRNTCGVCFKGYRLRSDGLCVWSVYDYIFYFNIFMAAVILSIVIYGVFFSKKKPLLAVLSGDDGYCEVAGSQAGSAENKARRLSETPSPPSFDHSNLQSHIGPIDTSEYGSAIQKKL
jgi:predicted amidophosphoribosyltransferase